MLFNGEAIFGVVDFSEDTRISLGTAQSVIDAAEKQAAPVFHKTVGPATLGWCGSGVASVTDRQISTHGRSLAVSIGELYERGEREALYNREPQRSGFVTRRFAAEGVPFLRRLDGTFATAIWNESEQELVLACDWRGDARLYYSVQKNQFLFSSWLPLLASLSSAIDTMAISEFLRFLYIAAPRTLYQGIARMDGNCYLRLTRGQVELKSLEHVTASGSANHPAQDLTEFQHHFEIAVRRRIGQRRVGVLLSGGVDSATLAAGCQRVNPGEVEAFTIGFDNTELDETAAARALAHQIGIPHRELRFDLTDYAAAFERVIESMEQPFGDPVELPLTLICESAKDSVEVFCDGTGSDGLFGAPMPPHMKFSLQTAARLPSAVRRGIGAALRRSAVGAVARQAPLFEFDDPEELLVTWPGWSRREMTELLGRAVDFSESGFYRVYRGHVDAGAQALFDAVGVFPPDDSRFDCAALAGAPLALPYHDIDLCHYVRGLPEHRRFAEGKSKVILRGLFAHYFPNAGGANKKHYFNMPLGELMARSNHALINEYLAPGILKKHGVVDAERVRPWILRYTAGENALRFKVWALVLLHAWLEAHR